MRTFDKNNERLCNQFENIQWITGSGLSTEELEVLVIEMEEKYKDLPKSILKAKSFSMILSSSHIAVDKEDVFQDKIAGEYILRSQRERWKSAIIEKYLSEPQFKIVKSRGGFGGDCDFGHTSSNSELLLKVGFTGLLERINKFDAREGLTQKQKTFYESCRICLEAILGFIERLASAIEPYNKENSIALYNIAKGKPSNIYEALQLIIIHFYLHDYIAASNISTLGRLDYILYPFYKNDIENGTFTKAEVKEMIKFFLNKLWCENKKDRFFGLPICLGGIDEKGEEVTNELSYMFVEAYSELDIYDPKFTIRVSNKTPEDFIKLGLKCIKDGSNAFVFVNDNTVIKSLIGVGTLENDAKNYIPVGCYEPIVFGKEIGCTGQGGINLAKAVEYVITNGVNLFNGTQTSIKTGKIKTYEELILALKQHIKFMIEHGLNYIREIEKYYDEIGPDPLLSSMYDRSVELGLDVFSGGAEYNNSSYYVHYIASFVDSVCAIKRLVFDEKRLTLEEFSEILKNNWEGQEELRLIAENLPEKYGNNNALADEITKEFTDYCASLINNQPNNRGGVFKASIFSIDAYISAGKSTMATPNGRKKGEPLSKNICASVGQDKNGVTALINSVAKIDQSKFPNGTALDVILHPSAVSGEEGLNAFYALLKTHMAKGGMALHGNVFNTEDLKKAQKEPEKYRNLQVRVCGWSAYFTNLSKTEQDCFIKQTETMFC